MGDDSHVRDITQSICEMLCSLKTQTTPVNILYTFFSPQELYGKKQVAGLGLPQWGTYVQCPVCVGIICILYINSIIFNHMQYVYIQYRSSTSSTCQSHHSLNSWNLQNSWEILANLGSWKSQGLGHQPYRSWCHLGIWGWLLGLRVRYQKAHFLGLTSTTDCQATLHQISSVASSRTRWRGRDK